MEREEGSLSDEAFFTPDEASNPFESEIMTLPRGSLPTEIAQIILSHSSDAPSLRALALSTSSFYRAFCANQQHILQDVLFNEFRPGVLPYALATLAAGRCLPRTDSGVKSLLDRISSSPSDAAGTAKPHWSLPSAPSHSTDDDETEKCWSLSDLLELSSTHEVIKFFTDNFANTTKYLRIPTASEFDRIEGAFYRYELFALFSERIRTNTQVPKSIKSYS